MKGERIALYFGYGWGRIGSGGHFLRGVNGGTFCYDWAELGLPWSEGLMDTGLLRNGKRADVVDGRVFHTCGYDAKDRAEIWHAFFWWDRSGDRRPNSNSGFYVRGFGLFEAPAAFAYACEQFPEVVARQTVPLSLQP